MTIFESSSILLNTVVGVLVIGYGIWLRNVFQHQIKAKDAVIEAKEAEISRLRGETAPAIAEAYSKMRAHADQMTRDANLLNQKLDEQTKVQPQIRLSVEAQLLVHVSQRMLDLIGPTLVGDYESMRRAIYQFIGELLAEANYNIDQLPEIERPKLSP
jgi:hypothetical protein